MKLGRVRLGTRFVFEDRGGVWEKVAEDKARCFFGKREEYGTEIAVSSETFVWAFSDRPERQGPTGPKVEGSGTRVIVVDDADNVLLEIADAGMSQVAAFVSVENIQLKPPKKRAFRNYMVLETYYRPVEDALCVDVREDKPIGREEPDEDEIPVAQDGAKDAEEGCVGEGKAEG